jgi:hypothetical protein
MDKTELRLRAVCCALEVWEKVRIDSWVKDLADEIMAYALEEDKDDAFVDRLVKQEESPIVLGDLPFVVIDDPNVVVDEAFIEKLVKKKEKEESVACLVKHVDLSDYKGRKIVGNDFLKGYKYLQEIDLSPLSEVETIEDNFLAGCVGLKSLNLLPLANVKSIGDGFLDGVPRNISTIFLGANNTVLFDAVVKWIGGPIIKSPPL